LREGLDVHGCGVVGRKPIHTAIVRSLAVCCGSG
jgi:hypothetical protein